MLWVIIASECTVSSKRVTFSFVRYRTQHELEIYNAGIKIVSSWGAAQLIFAGCPCIFSEGRAAMLGSNWQDLDKAALLEIDPTKLVTRIQAAQRVIAQQESRTDVAELERCKLADAQSMLKSLSRIPLPS